MNNSTCDACDSSDISWTTKAVSLCSSEDARHESIRSQSEIYELIEKSDQIDLLSKLCYHGMAINISTGQGGPDSIDTTPHLLRHAASLCWEIGGTDHQESGDDYKQLVSALNEHTFAQAKRDSERTASADATTDPEIETELRDEHTIAGRFSTGLQERRLARLRYGPESEFPQALENEFGFSIDDIISFADDFKRINDRLEIPIINFLNIWANNDVSLTKMIDNLGPQRLNQIWIHDKNINNLLERSINSAEKRNRTKTWMTAELGGHSGLAATEDPLEDCLPYRCPFDISPFERDILVRAPPSWYLPAAPSAMFRTIADSFYYDLYKSDDEFDKQWQNNFERVIAQAVCDLGPDLRIFCGENLGRITHSEERPERDVLIIGDSNDGNTFLIDIECKSRERCLGFRENTRAGKNTFNDIWEELSTVVSDAYWQLQDTEEILTSNDPVRIFREEGTEIRLDSIDHFVPIIALDGHLGRFLTADFFEHFSMMHGGIDEMPYVADYYTLDILARLSNLKEFAEYVSLRSKLYQSDVAVFNIDELDVFGAYLVGDLTEDLISNPQQHHTPGRGVSGKDIFRGCNPMSYDVIDLNDRIYLHFHEWGSDLRVNSIAMVEESDLPPNFVDLRP